ncbi:LysR family transcriptional regulator [Aestuariibius insulae]|uniref:LysR family transcriptional regulator n=1 Tax=Aestuariibius insulae TaxID=2058287 RepID=UPI00345EC156
MNISIRQLQTFVEVMRSESLSQAARNLGRTQPAISAMISSLEEEVGFTLFERVRKRLIPKPEAHYFLAEAETILDRITRSTRTLQDIADLKTGRIRLACNPAASRFFMPHVIGRFLADKPQVDVSLMMRSSPVVTDWVASQKYDIGLAESSETTKTISREVFEFRCFCAVPVGDALAASPLVTPRDLSGRPAALIYDEHSVTRQIERAFHHGDARLWKRFELTTYQPALQLTAEGLCYVICDSFTAASHVQQFGADSGVVFRPFEPHMALSMSLMTPVNRPLSMLAVELTKVISKELKRYLSFPAL